MSKKLSAMSLEELWELFPIILQEHQCIWSEWYEEELKALQQMIPLKIMKRISHIGSTAVNSIWAKPIIDILLELENKYDLSHIKEILLRNGYQIMSEETGRMSFNKGYAEEGFEEKVYHLHVRYAGDHDELYFRDYIREHKDIAQEYEQLKLKLWRQYEHNRDAYTHSKTEFIIKYTKRAKEEFGCRYE